MAWNVYFNKKARKQLDTMPLLIRETAQALVQEMEKLGPLRYNWKNFGSLKGSDRMYHCHIKDGRPTYVVCWEVKDKKIKIIEVYYVGTHEKAPY